MPAQKQQKQGQHILKGRAAFTLAARQLLVHKMVYGWRRRGQTLLEVNCGAGFFLDGFWEAGFNVNGQEKDRDLAQNARDRLGGKAEIALASPEHLPYEDDFFDYAVCVNGMDNINTPNPQNVMAEMLRVASKGVLIAFSNIFSAYGLGYVLSGKIAPQDGGAFPQHPINSFRLWSMLRKEIGQDRISWGSNLLGPAWSWGSGSEFLGRVLRAWNLASVPFPLGAFAVMRVDLAPAVAGNQILIPHGGRLTPPKFVLADPAVGGGTK